MVKDLSSSQIRNILKSRWPQLKHIWLFSPMYTAISGGDFEKILNNLQPINQQFNKNKFDCDKFALVTQALVSLATSKDENLTYDVIFGQIILKHNISKEVHAINIFINSDE